jgi:hypothetical protein
MPKARFFRLFAVGLILGPHFAVAQAKMFSALVVPMPETWALSDSIGFFALVGVIFAMMIRRRLPRPKKSQN